MLLSLFCFKRMFTGKLTKDKGNNKLDTETLRGANKTSSEKFRVMCVCVYVALAPADISEVWQLPSHNRDVSSPAATFKNCKWPIAEKAPAARMPAGAPWTRRSDISGTWRRQGQHIFRLSPAAHVKSRCALVCPLRALEDWQCMFKLNVFPASGNHLEWQSKMNRGAALCFFCHLNEK